MAYFGGGGGFGPKITQLSSDHAEIFTRGSTKGGKISVWRIFEKSEFWPKREIPKVWTFCPTLRLIYPLKMAEIGENKSTVNKNSAIGLSKSGNPNPAALLPFKWKIELLFALFERFFVKKGAWSHFKSSKSKSHLAYCSLTILGHIPVQTVWSHRMPVLSLSVTKVVFFKFSTTFSSFAAFLGTTPLI